jgi:hypothetical protein
MKCVGYRAHNEVVRGKLPMGLHRQVNAESLWPCLFILMAGLTACAAYALEGPSRTWDGWVGKHKDALVKERGIPAQCVSLRAGEVCEWGAPEVGAADRVTVGFDKHGLACQWTYRGFYGERRSTASCPD